MCAYRPTATDRDRLIHILFLPPIPCHLSLRQGSFPTSSVHGTNERTRNNQSTITNTIRIGLGNGDGAEGRPASNSHRELNSLDSPSFLSLPHSENGREIHSCRPPNKLSFSLKGNFPF